MDQLWQMNMRSALCASHLAMNIFHRRAQAIFPLQGSASMAAYGLAKAATHQLVQSLSQSLESPAQTVVGLLPNTINTEANRVAMPGICTSTWTPVDVIAQEIVGWTIDGPSRPVNGTFQSIVTQQHTTSWIPVVV